MVNLSESVLRLKVQIEDVTYDYFYVLRNFLHPRDKKIDRVASNFTDRVGKQKAWPLAGFFKSHKLSVKALFVRSPKSLHIYC